MTKVQSIIFKKSGVVADMQNRELEVREFELHSRYYVHLRTNTFGKGMNPLIPRVMG